MVYKDYHNKFTFILCGFKYAHIISLSIFGYCMYLSIVEEQ